MAREHQVWDACCLTCEEGISNPLCPGCVAEEIAHCVSHKSQELAEQIRSLPETLNGVDTGNQSCIICGTRVNICAYCFMSMLLDTFPEDNLLISEVLEENMGYYADLFIRANKED